MRRIHRGTVVGLGIGVLVGTAAIAIPVGNAFAEDDCTNPADVLDLEGWKMTLPVGEDEEPTEITQPELADFDMDPWFTPLDDCSGVQFRSAVNGVTTGGSSYPRSELREMTADGSDEASWSSDSGTHTMVVNEAITDVPNDKPEVVSAQIHDDSDDVSVFRLEDTSLYVTDGDESEDYTLITDEYELGTPFEAKFVVADNKIEAYFNGELVTTLDADFQGGYFKAGAYTQANCEKSDPCADDNFGQVEIYDIQVSHEE